jgi:hypothetical protein
MINMAEIDKFWKYVNKTNNCWEWTRSLNSQGYGNFSLGQHKVYRAHRWIYEYVHNKKLPKDIYVCHVCDNPKCVRPDHLFEGTQKDNMQDMIQKKRQAKNKKGISKLTELDIKLIRQDKRKRKYIAEQYNVDVATVSRIRLGQTWSWLK